MCAAASSSCGKDAEERGKRTAVKDCHESNAYDDQSYMRALSCLPAAATLWKVPAFDNSAPNAGCIDTKNGKSIVQRRGILPLICIFLALPHEAISHWRHYMPLARSNGGSNATVIETSRQNVVCDSAGKSSSNLGIKLGCIASSGQYLWAAAADWPARQRLSCRNF